MSQGELGITKVEVASGQDVNATGDKLVIPVFKPVDVQRIGLIQDGSTDPGTGLVVAIDHRPTAGSDTGRVQLFTMSPGAAIGQGNGIYADADDRYEVDAGGELVIEVTTGGASGATAHLVAELRELPFAGARVLDTMTEVTAG